MVSWILSVFQYRPGGRPARAYDDESWLLALAVPNTACRGNAGYARLDRLPDDSVRGSQGVLGGLGTLVRHLHCPSDVHKRNHSLLYTPSGAGGGAGVGLARPGRRPIFHLYRGLSVAGDSPRLGRTQVLAKCSHPELNPKETLGIVSGEEQRWCLAAACGAVGKPLGLARRVNCD